MAPNRFQRDTVGSAAEYTVFDADDGPFSIAETTVLDHVNAKIAAGASLDDVMNFLFDTIHTVIPCDRLGLAFLEDDGRRVIAHWARATYEPLWLRGGFSQDLEGSSLQRILATGEPRIIADLEHYGGEHPGSISTHAILREGLRSSMTCPLCVDDPTASSTTPHRAVGFLFLSSRQPNAYARRHVRLHLAIAERLSQAVEKTWRIERLYAANQAYFEILGFVSHELKSPLASMIMDIYSIENGTFGPVSDILSDRLQRMEQKAQHLLGMVDEYIGLSRIESGSLEASFQSEVDFRADVLEPSIAIVDGLARNECMVTAIECPESLFPVACDPGMMSIVMVNLLSNAIKYGNAGSRIRVHLDTADGRLRVSVRNEGPGFPSEEKPRLFRKFSRLQTPELLKRKGTGVGLYSAWRIIQLHGGRIWADSEIGKWAEFSFEIPLAPGHEWEGRAIQ